MNEFRDGLVLKSCLPATGLQRAQRFTCCETCKRDRLLEGVVGAACAVDFDCFSLLYARCFQEICPPPKNKVQTSQHIIQR